MDKTSHDEPDLVVAGLALWVFSREFPKSDDYWDGNWLVARARVEGLGARVEISGSWLRSEYVEAFASQLEAVEATLKGEATLTSLEPALEMVIRCETLGRVKVSISITPDFVNQSHRFTFDIDQSFLRPALNSCRRILARYPVVGNRD